VPPLGSWGIVLGAEEGEGAGGREGGGGEEEGEEEEEGGEGGAGGRARHGWRRLGTQKGWEVLYLSPAANLYV